MSIFFLEVLTLKSFPLIPANIMSMTAVSEVLKSNSLTCKFGLYLSKSQAEELVTTRNMSLENLGRVEFGGGIINKLIYEFCDSPYISQYNYTETINDLIETFYYFKNETLDEVSDDDLLSLMKEYFDQYCNGSIELLQGRELEVTARNKRYSKKNYTVKNPKEKYKLILEREDKI